MPLKLKITLTEAKRGEGKFCFVDFTKIPGNPKPCVDLSSMVDRLYDGNALSKVAHVNTAIYFVEEVLPYYSDNCVPLPKATHPSTPPGGAIYQGGYDLTLDDQYTKCPALHDEYTTKTEL